MELPQPDVLLMEKLFIVTSLRSSTSLPGKSSLKKKKIKAGSVAQWQRWNVFPQEDKDAATPG